MHIQDTPVLVAKSLGTDNVRGIYPHHQPILVLAGMRRIVGEELPQSCAIKQAIFKAFIEAEPFSLEERREGQFNKALSRRFGQ